jgi:NTE family protein
LALQGGGAHGAFTWGILDRLLEDDRIKIEGICGTSAGALTGVLVADGLDREGKEGARKALRRFWMGVSAAGRFSPLQRTLLDRLFGRWTLDWSPSYISFDLMTRILSPYQINPLDINSLRSLIASLIDFDHVIPKPLQRGNLVSKSNDRTGDSPADSMTGKMPVLPKKVLLV